MALETAIAELNTNILSLVAAMKVTSENQERLIAGQKLAVEKVEGAKATRTRTTKTPDPAVAETVKQPEAPPATSAKPAPTEDELRAAAAKYLGDKNADLAAYQARGTWMKSMLEHLGSPKIVGADSTLDDDGKKQALFYLTRKGEGLPVDFSADYDFDGDPLQGDGAPDTSDDDMIG